MRIIVIGLGVQGKKRQACAGSDYIASVDPVCMEADYRHVHEVALSDYDAALVCVPDDEKYAIIRYLLLKSKHVLVEKPLWVAERSQIIELEALASQHGCVLYTAYNHRFEPHIQAILQRLQAHPFGRIYRCRLFYGNGTAKLVRASPWRDCGGGVLNDLCSHLLDMVDYWFGLRDFNYRCIDVQRHENQAPDYILVLNQKSSIKIVFEMTLLSWRNTFSCDILAEKGSLHIDSLCKWGPSRFIERHRVLPSGHPTEKVMVLTQSDPTWALEYQYFKSLVEKNQILDLNKDLWIYDQLQQLVPACMQDDQICVD